MSNHVQLYGELSLKELNEGVPPSFCSDMIITRIIHRNRKGTKKRLDKESFEMKSIPHGESAYLCVLCCTKELLSELSYLEILEHTTQRKCYFCKTQPGQSRTTF